MLTKEYWKDRYQTQQMGWDAGQITRPIKTYFDAVEDKSVKILIPGCGNAHEAAYLFNQGFTNLYLCDWAQEPLDNFAQQHPSFPKEQLICANFFELEEKDFDYIVEQTFFCALTPSLRPQYALKMAQILKEGGLLVGLLFSAALDLGREGPPFGGNKAEYIGYFEPYFSNLSIEPCLNSIPPRAGVELFIELTK
ncbi:TPMT family class I SAM-dependent methyltransferase [Aureispira anguillae]|uniref:TPMT family class I SAM-dependent methyltransferase n=1 Tax=Aureispira anguillae TaxID=2864201 RepID=A0A915YH57_9BACT|nr:TPMT family class I SAM-dependent methyltransferase [Aureispira anguillae]BDS12934.1 TPMT family class I SAM-dependent methyltransferase [Aureispira anguillae]